MSHRFDRTRRRLLQGGAAASAGLLLRGLATGLAPAWLAAPRHAFGQQQPMDVQTLILATSAAGDPVNVNVPGAYVDGVINNPDPRLARTAFRLGEVNTEGAQPWSTLPGALRQRLAFFHHRTRSVAHVEHANTLSFHGSVKNAAGNGAEMLPSAFAEIAAGPLGTLQPEPLPLGSETITVGGQPLQGLRPSAIKALFAENDPALVDLRSTRDQALDALYADLRADGTRAQRQFLDRYAQSRAQARALGEQLGALLERLPLVEDDVDGPADQVLAAVALARLRVAPVITIRLPFGGDNHNDVDLLNEAEQTIASVGHIQSLWAELGAADLTDAVTFALLNVFGRSHTRNNAGGRNHNRQHAVMVAFGAGVRGGVYGGINGDGGCTGLDPVTGAARPDGGIIADETMEAAGKSLAVAMGFDRAEIDTRIQGGAVVEGFVR